MMLGHALQLCPESVEKATVRGKLLQNHLIMKTCLVPTGGLNEAISWLRAIRQNPFPLAVVPNSREEIVGRQRLEDGHHRGFYEVRVQAFGTAAEVQQEKHIPWCAFSRNKPRSETRVEQVNAKLFGANVPVEA